MKLKIHTYKNNIQNVMSKARIIFSVLLFVATVSKAQDYSLMQFNSVPLFYNPGYAGSVESPRIALSYNHVLPNQTSHSYLSYDQAIKRIHSGVGLVMSHNNYGNTGNKDNYFRAFYCGVAYAAKFNLSPRLAISPAIKIGYRKDEISYSNINPTSNTHEVITSFRQNADIAAGVVINTEKFHFGFAIDHLNNPRIASFAYGESTLHMKYIAQMGYTFQKTKGSDFSVTTGLLFQKQQESGELRMNVSARYKFAVLGGGLYVDGISRDFYHILVGYYSKKCMVGYSFEPHVAGSTSPKYFRHELSVRYIFSPPKDEKAIDDKPAKKRRVFKNRKRILQS